MDYMEWYEIGALLKYNHLKHHSEYDSARLVSYTVAQCNTKRQINHETYMRFPWEDEKKIQDKKIGGKTAKKKRQSVEKTEAVRLHNKAEEFAKNFKAPAFKR